MTIVFETSVKTIAIEMDKQYGSLYYTYVEGKQVVTVPSAVCKDSAFSVEIDPSSLRNSKYNRSYSGIISVQAKGSVGEYSSLINIKKSPQFPETYENALSDHLFYSALINNLSDIVYSIDPHVKLINRGKDIDVDMSLNQSGTLGFYSKIIYNPRNGNSSGVIDFNKLDTTGKPLIGEYKFSLNSSCEGGSWLIIPSSEKRGELVVTLPKSGEDVKVSLVFRDSSGKEGSCMSATANAETYTINPVTDISLFHSNGVKIEDGDAVSKGVLKMEVKMGDADLKRNFARIYRSKENCVDGFVYGERLDVGEINGETDSGGNKNTGYIDVSYFAVSQISSFKIVFNNSNTTKPNSLDVEQLWIKTGYDPSYNASSYGSSFQENAVYSECTMLPFQFEYNFTEVN